MWFLATHHRPLHLASEGSEHARRCKAKCPPGSGLNMDGLASPIPALSFRVRLPAQLGSAPTLVPRPPHHYHAHAARPGLAQPPARPLPPTAPRRAAPCGGSPGRPARAGARARAPCPLARGSTWPKFGGGARCRSFVTIHRIDYIINHIWYRVPCL